MISRQKRRKLIKTINLLPDIVEFTRYQAKSEVCDIISIEFFTKNKEGFAMNAVDIINKKRLGGELTVDETEYMVMGYTRGDVPDYQMSALLMAICCSGISKDETVELTRIMRDSGDTVDLSAIKGIKVDKHSTGGVGDKTTLIVAPVAAACGVPIAKMSGRGLGFTGGTVDKMESIPGFRTTMKQDEFINSVNTRGIAVIGQTGQIAPADKKIYALRDVTATTENIGLITSSIMSKKLAAGADAIVLDVKCGSGAFMKKYEDAEELAEWMVDIGKAGGKKMMALISDMNQPLGNAVGNALEVQEAIDVLKGEGPDDITELSISLAGAMVYLGGIADTMESGKKKAGDALSTGKALDKFREFVSGQGGNPDITRDHGLLPQAGSFLDVKAETGGYISRLDAMRIGLASQHTGAGRQRKDDKIDMSAGIVLKRKLGDIVSKGDVICTVYGNDRNRIEAGAKEAAGAFEITEEKPGSTSLIKKIIY